MQNRKFLLLSAAAMLNMMSRVIISRKKNIRRRRKWCRAWLQRRTCGKDILTMLNKELRTEDPISYRNFLRLTEPQFDYLLNLIQPNISKKNTFMRESISARNKLEVTLRFLATGESYRSLMYSTRIHESTISRFVPVVCEEICKHLKITYLKTPRTVSEWEKIAEDFCSIWQFPHCVGALDGRHINFRAPISDGSYYFNYKGNNSIVLLALTDAHYRFTYVNLGVNGRISDGGVFQQCSLARVIKNNIINFPPLRELPGSTIRAPYVIVADEAFPLMENLMKPYPHRGLNHDSRIFNYRLSRARRIIENSFGILANRFRVLLNPINLSANKVEIITLTCVILHNYLATENENKYTDMYSESDQQQHQQLRKIGRQGGNNHSNSARHYREEFKKYFNSPAGQVTWQENSIKHNNM